MYVRRCAIKFSFTLAASLAVYGECSSAAEVALQRDSESTRPAAAYVEKFTSLLLDGFRGTRRSLDEAERQYDAAKRLDPDDPLLDYAYGLVLMKNHRHSDAMAMFKEAAAASRSCLPAQRALTRETLRKKQYDQALEELTSLSRVINEHSDNDPETVETARWVGLAIGFLTGPQMTEATREQAAACDAGLRDQLKPAFREHYDLGKQDVLVIEGQFQIEQQSAEASAKLKQQAEEQQAASRREAYQAQQEQLLETKEQWDAWLADTLSALDAQLDQLGDRFDTLNRSIVSLVESIQLTQLEIKRLQTLLDIRNRQRREDRNSSGNGAIEVQLLARSRELDAYVNELSDATTEREMISRQGRTLLVQRSAAEQKYRDATGSVAKQASRVQRWDARLKTSMEQAQNAPASSRKLKAINSRVQSFTSYDPFDLDTEQQRLLHIYDEPEN